MIVSSDASAAASGTIKFASLLLSRVPIYLYQSWFYYLSFVITCILSEKRRKERKGERERDWEFSFMKRLSIPSLSTNNTIIFIDHRFFQWTKKKALKTIPKRKLDPPSKNGRDRSWNKASRVVRKRARVQKRRLYEGKKKKKWIERGKIRRGLACRDVNACALCICLL